MIRIVGKPVMSMTAVRGMAASASAGKNQIDLYYDVLSPFSWFAFEVLHRYKPLWKIDLHLKPVLLGGILKEIGVTPEMSRPRNVNYHRKDMVRCANYFNVPFKLNVSMYDSVLEKGSLAPSRFLTAIDLLYPSHLEAASRELWKSVYNKHQDFTTVEVMTEAGLAAGLSGDDLAKVQEHMNQPSTKERLKAYTDEAIKHGVFGVPSIMAHVREKPSLFFGSDRFHLLAEEINETWLGPEPETPRTKL